MKTVTNYLLMGIVAIAMFVGYGCSQDGVLDNHWNQERQMSESEKYVKQVHYDTYLSLSSKDIVLSELTEEEHCVLRIAFTRLTYEYRNGLMYIKQTSGQEVNISENIYEYFKSLTYKYNEKKRKYIPATIKTRSVDISVDINENTRTDCVAWALTYVAYKWNLETTIYEDLTAQYENGVPLSDITGIFLEFANTHNLTMSSLTFSNINHSDFFDLNVKMITIVKDEDNNHHAMILDGVNGNTLLGIDSSVTQSQHNGYYTVDDIVGIIRFQKPY